MLYINYISLKLEKMKTLPSGNCLKIPHKYLELTQNKFSHYIESDNFETRSNEN